MWLERQFARFFGVTFSENNSPTALKDREALFRDARENIKVVSSELSPQMDLLMEAVENGVTVEVITKKGQSFSDIVRLARKGVRLFEVDKVPQQQFDIVDEKHGRFEEPDGPGTSSRLQYVVRNFDSITEWLHRFALLKERAVPYTIP